LYRALIIAETEKNVNYSILIPAVILHDIGVTEDMYQHHIEKGSMIIKRDLPRLGYSKKEIEQITHAVVCHSNNPKPDTIEGKILFDADRLEKSGIGGVFSSYRAQLELKKSVSEWAYPRFYKNKDFFTKKAKEISGKGFDEMDKHFNEVKKSLKKRKDWVVTEKELWE
jgi:HD superfamily phosphodiesterase